MADQKIAEKAVEQLYLDRKKGFNHVLMARVDFYKKELRMYFQYTQNIRNLARNIKGRNLIRF